MWELRLLALRMRDQNVTGHERRCAAMHSLAICYILVPPLRIMGIGWANGEHEHLRLVVDMEIEAIRFLRDGYVLKPKRAHKLDVPRRFVE